MAIAARKPIVIGHRGACGYRPEHTLASYRLAIALGADYIEPDLVATKDGVLIARHENELSSSTDVAQHPEFRDRHTTKLIDGQRVTGWFSEDFSLAEIKTLRARQPFSFRDRRFDGWWEIPTLVEILELLAQIRIETGKIIGIYPETKHPSYFAAQSLPLEDPLIQCLHQFGYQFPSDPVFIQSFEVTNLQYLRQITELPLIQLIGSLERSPYDGILSGDRRCYRDWTTPPSLQILAQTVQGIGCAKADLVVFEVITQQWQPTPLLLQAKQAGVQVHAYTFRNETQFIDPSFQNQPDAEYEVFFRLGIDGVFSDFPDRAVTVRDRLNLLIRD
jgi:glycerophosphoryl diester phosphodiesterase